MQNKTMLLFIVALVFLVQQAFAQSPYTDTERVICSNSICERAWVELLVGEEKSIDIGGKLHTIKAVRIEKTPEGGYYHYLSIDGGSPMTSWEAEQSLDSMFSSSISFGPIGKPGQPLVIQEATPGSSPPEPDRVVVYLYEDKICAVPDCAFGAELGLYKKWNLVPLYFLSSSSSSDIEKALKKGTCKLQDFTAIYGYDSINKKYVNLYSWGRSSSDLATSISNFGRIDETNKLLVGTPFNSVWIYSSAACRLVAQAPNQFKNFLLILAAAGADRTETVAVAVKQGEEALPPQTRTIEGIKFAPGWNFFMGSPDMEGKSLDEIKGSCIIEKAHTFDASSQSWKQLTAGVGMSSNFVFKVTNKCMLGMPQVAPPEIPT